MEEADSHVGLKILASYTCSYSCFIVNKCIQLHKDHLIVATLCYIALPVQTDKYVRPM